MNIDFEPLERTSITRKPVFARQGVVATSQPLASQAGLEMLRRGGNAVDAAIAAAVTLTVVEPVSNDVGGDNFAIVWDGKQLHGLNGSGRSPAGHSIEAIRRRGYSQVPPVGWFSATVPGAPAAWRDLHEKFGKLPFASLFEPAITYAEQGYPLAPTNANSWRLQVELVHPQLSGEQFSGFFPVYAPNGRAPRIGEMWRNPDLARTLQIIAETKAEGFYRGEIAQKIAAFATKTGGLFTEADFAAHTSTWVTPISTNYRGFDVWEIPPNGQGITALIALNILEGFDLASMGRDSTESYHVQIEAMKLAFADTHRYVTDPEREWVPVQEMLSKSYADERRKLISTRAGRPTPGRFERSGTVQFCAADKDGMMVSFIQSNYAGFGSHVVIPGTGMLLQNRGVAFSLDPRHPNRLEPNKRTFHTIIPGFLTRDGNAIGPFGVMGGHMQPQGHAQMIVNTVDYHMDPQTSLNAARWMWWYGSAVHLEPHVPDSVVEGLSKRGHDVEVDVDLEAFGRGQIIWRLDSGAYMAGSDNRADGCAVGY